MKKEFFKIKRGRIISIAIFLVIIGGGFWYTRTTRKPSMATITVARGTIVQEVSVTGTTKPLRNVSLAFEVSGRIARVNADVGNKVEAGESLVELDAAGLLASETQAEAKVEAEKAALEKLQNGARPEDIAVSQVTLDAAIQTLLNDYNGVYDTMNDAYAKSDDAVRNQTNQMFSNGDSNPQLTFTVTDSQIKNDTELKRLKAGLELATWKKELQALSPTSATATLDVALQNAGAHLATIQDFLNKLSDAISNSVGLADATVSTYKTNINTGRTNVNLGASNVRAKQQTISGQKVAVEQAQSQLDLTRAAATPEDIRAQRAAVVQAEASLQNAQVAISKTILRSPITGVVAQQDAKVGEIAAPNAPLVAVLAPNNLEIEANIPEVDIGKINIGDSAKVTLDAFQGKTFAGKVSYVEPSENVIEGVPTYKTKFQFDSLGPEVKPGMTANIDIVTETHTNALYVPQRAVVIEGDGTRSVMVYHNDNSPLEKRVVTTGLRDTEGNIEILSGLDEGETILRSQ